MEASSTRPPENFFVARDIYDTALYYGRLNLSLTEGVMFRVLLENVMYRPKKDTKPYGYVSESALGVDTLARVCCMSYSTAKAALSSLERAGMIRRERRPKTTGGSSNSEIIVTWLTEGLRNGPSEGL